MTRPVIGISAYSEQARWGVWDLPATLLPQSYADQVAVAGGAPVLLPPVQGIEAAVASLDGLITVPRRLPRAAGDERRARRHADTAPA